MRNALRPDIQLHPADVLDQVIERPGKDQVRFDRYHVLDRLGVGGMAEVFHAVGWDDDGRLSEVVIKRLRPELAYDQRFVLMFRLEAKIGLLLQHRNLVAVHRLVRAKGGDYMVMDYVDGVNLTDAINVKRGPFVWREVMRIALEVADALAFAHEIRDQDSDEPLGLVHRDVSPANIMLTGEGVVKVLDFGIAKALNKTGDDSLIGELKGKLGYMAPEQMLGLDLDQRVDQFSLGVVLYECLSGRKLFRRSGSLREMIAERCSEVRPVSECVSGLPRWVDEMLQRLMQPNRELRFESMRDLAQLVKQNLGAIDQPSLSLARLARQCRPASSEHDTLPGRPYSAAAR